MKSSPAFMGKGDPFLHGYALFVELALQWVRPGGIICLIIPMSFVGGPYFAALRKRILEKATVLRLDLIDKRSDVFLDVLYDLWGLPLAAVVHSRLRSSAPSRTPREPDGVEVPELLIPLP
jgi:hypothetical protein